jgi:hypothetical protein
LCWSSTQGRWASRPDYNFIATTSSPAQLRDAFPIKTGQWFDRNNIGKGLERLGHLYATSGHLDYYSVPDTQVALGNKINLKVKIHEGSQYRMGNLEVFAPKELAEKTATQWDLKPGTVFDLSYPEKFVEDHRQLFPPSFQSDHIQRARNCRDFTVDVRIPIDRLDPRSHTPFPESSCANRKAIGVGRISLRRSDLRGLRFCLSQRHNQSSS